MDSINMFFANIYGWFCDRNYVVYQIMDKIVDSYYGDTLLSGYFPVMGIWAVVISVVFAFAFYIWPINHPRFYAWWSWLIMLILNAAVNFGLTFAFINHRLAEVNKNADAIALFTDENVLDISSWDKCHLAFSNLMVSALVFIIASAVLMWFSTSAKYSPFRK